MSHHHEDHDEIDVRAMFTREYWDERYAGSDRVWSGNPNPRLVEQVAGLPAGTAYDLGCGEGADVVWLARQGWQVTGVDVSQVALDRAAGHAAEAGVAERTSWVRADLLAGDALPGQADLVSAQFLHAPPELFDELYAGVLGAVAPGGLLLVVAHHPDDRHTGLRNPRLSELLFTPARVTALLEPGSWQVLVEDTPTREHTTAAGERHTVTDTVVLARRT